MIRQLTAIRQIVMKRVEIIGGTPRNFLKQFNCREDVETGKAFCLNGNMIGSLTRRIFAVHQATI